MMKYHGMIIECLHLKRWSITRAGENLGYLELS